MAGTKAGGLKAAQKNLASDPLFYKKIGKKGGEGGNTGGFASNPALAKVAGAKGGRISKRKRVEKAGGEKPKVYICPNCGSDRYISSILGCICPECFYEPKLKIKILNDSDLRDLIEDEI